MGISDKLMIKTYLFSEVRYGDVGNSLILKIFFFIRVLRMQMHL